MSLTTKSPESYPLTIKWRPRSRQQDDKQTMAKRAQKRTERKIERDYVGEPDYLCAFAKISSKQSEQYFTLVFVSNLLNLSQLLKLDVFDGFIKTNCGLRSHYYKRLPVIPILRNMYFFVCLRRKAYGRFETRGYS